MTLTTWLAYLGVISIFILIPGPSALLCIDHGAQRPFRIALITAYGSTAASLILITLAFFGVGLLLNDHIILFNGAKLIGGLYLLYIAYEKLSTKDMNSLNDSQTYGAKFQGLWVGLSNPKDILFFATLLPNFINWDHPLMPQYLLFSLTWIFLDVSVLSGYCFIGKSSSKTTIVKNNQHLFAKLMAVMLVLLAVGILANIEI